MYIKKHGRDFAFPDYGPNYPRSPDFKLQHVSVKIKVFVDDKMIEGIATLLLESLKDGLKYIPLDAMDMTIKEVKVNGVSADYSYDGEKIHIYLSKELGQGQKISVVVSYTAKPKKGLYFVLPDKYYPDRVPQIWSQGETEDNRYWIPLYDYPNMKCTSEFIVYAPKQYYVISNGRLLEEKEEGDWKVWHWRMDKPHSTYLIALAIGLFDVIEDKVGSIPLIYAVPKGRKEDISRSFSRTGDIIKFFEEYTGVPYPWDNYKQVCVSEFIYGGMENTTLTILTEHTLHDEKAHIDFESEPLVAHEAAHQWFGDLVTTKDWGNIWLNEGFATYLEALYRRHWKGKNEFIYEMIINMDEYLKEYKSRYSRPIVTRVYKYPSELFDAHSYPKGALVLHTLSSIIGEDKFRLVLKRFLERFKYKSADTEDFRKVVEEVTGKDFEWFFDQYVYNAGHPELSISYSYDAEMHALKINIKQIQGEDCWDVYRIPLEIRIKTKHGYEKRLVMLKEKEQTFYFPMDEKVECICVDPDFKIFAVIDIKHKLEQLVKELKCDSVYCRILAARALAKHKSSRAIEALREALISDEFWGVSAEAANSLGKIGTREALEALIHAEKIVKHPKVRRAIARALGLFKDEESAKVLSKILKDDSESYYVRAEAAVSLGKTRWNEAFKHLREALMVKSHNDVILRGALSGLAELGTDEAFNIIKQYVSKGKPTLVRATAITALAKFPDKKEAIDLIVDASKDENMRVRYATVMAAQQMMSPKLLPMLDKLADEDLDERIRRRARETARKIRKHLERGVEYQKLREEIEKIKEENRRLLDRISRIEIKS